MMGGAYAGSALVRQFQRDAQDRAEGNPLSSIDPDLLVGAVASMAGLLGPDAREDGVHPHRQSHNSRANDLGSIARHIGIGALSSWAMRRGEEMGRANHASRPTIWDGWGGNADGHGGHEDYLEGEGNGDGDGYGYADGAGEVSVLPFIDGAWSFGERHAWVSTTNDDCRRTDRVFRCAGCVGGFECPLHGRRL